jgi:hypothetical protein
MLQTVRMQVSQRTSISAESRRQQLLPNALHDRVVNEMAREDASAARIAQFNIGPSSVTAVPVVPLDAAASVAVAVVVIPPIEEFKSASDGVIGMEIDPVKRESRPSPIITREAPVVEPVSPSPFASPVAASPASPLPVLDIPPAFLPFRQVEHAVTEAQLVWTFVEGTLRVHDMSFARASVGNFVSILQRTQWMLKIAESLIAEGRRDQYLATIRQAKR